MAVFPARRLTVGAVKVVAEAGTMSFPGGLDATKLQIADEAGDLIPCLAPVAAHCLSHVGQQARSSWANLSRL